MKAKNGDVVITGLGPVTSIGVGCNELWASLLAGRSNVAARSLPIDVGRTIELPLASLPAPRALAGSETLADFLDREECGSYRDLAYALRAVELALADAAVEYDRDHNRIGVIQAFEAPGVEATTARLFELLGMVGAPPPPGTPPGTPPPVYDLLAPYFYRMQPFLYVHLMGKALGLHGFSTSLHNACSSGAHAIEVAANHIRAGQADVMVVAGGEAFETGVRIEWFRRLELYARDARMAPFDREPTGFYLGEGGAAMVLESARHAEQRGARIYATYLGGAFAQQGWKQTLPDVRAGRLRHVICDALERTGVSPAELDLIVPHGTATALSDGYESSCLAAALKGEATRAVATAFKPNVGHQLAAGAVIETVCALLALHHQCIPPTLNTRADAQTFAVPVVTSRTERTMGTVLKLCTGFTGHDAALLFRKP